MTRNHLRYFMFLTAFVIQHLNANSANAVKVIWDIGHGVVDNYRPNGSYSALVNQLAPAGFQFTESTVPIERLPFDDFQILVLANGSFAEAFPSAAELNAVEKFLGRGGSLLIMADAAGTSGAPKIQQFANLFDAQVGVSQFPSLDVFSTSVIPHPAVAGVDSVYLRFGSSLNPGKLSSYVFHNDLPMLAAGEFNGGRIVLIADGDLFATAPGVAPPFIDRADNRQLADSVFSYLAVPEPNAISLAMVSVPMLCAMRRRLG
jgi:hypothetical protein